MIEAMEKFKALLASNFEIDDWQAVDILIATAVSHKLPAHEMLWLRLVGASGTGKTELLRTLIGQKEFCATMESITAGSIRRGHISKGQRQPTLLERINGQLVVTKEFAALLTKNLDSQKEIFGLLRSVHDGELDADYGSEEGHLSQKSRFDWIVGTTQYIDRQRQLETQLGSRFIDLRWEAPEDRVNAVERAILNDWNIEGIRQHLVDSLAVVIQRATFTHKPDVRELSLMANVAAIFRTPVERDNKSREIMEIPEVELGTRLGQAMQRIADGLSMLGVPDKDMKPYLNRVVFDSMARMRAKVIKAWVRGVTKQRDIAAMVGLSEGAISRIIEEIKVLGWDNDMLVLLNGEKRL